MTPVQELVQYGHFVLLFADEYAKAMMWVVLFFSRLVLSLCVFVLWHVESQMMEWEAEMIPVKLLEMCNHTIVQQNGKLVYNYKELFQEWL